MPLTEKSDPLYCHLHIVSSFIQPLFIIFVYVMSSEKTTESKFMIVLFKTVFSLLGRVNFSQLTLNSGIVYSFP